MRKLPTGLTAALLAATTFAPSLLPANAAPLSFPRAAVVTPQSDVIQVDYDDWWVPTGAFVAGALIGGAIANNNYYGGGYYGGYYGSNYYGGGYYPRYYGGYYPRYYPRYYRRYYPRYYEPARVYYQPRSSYRAGYRDGYRDGYYARPYGNDITCTSRLQDAGKC